MNYQIKPHCIGLNQVERIDIETINNWINKKMLYFKLWGFKPDDMQDNNIKKENSVAIGDSMNDLCMIKEAGLGIAFCSKDELLNHHADVIIRKPEFSELLNLTK